MIFFYIPQYRSLLVCAYVCIASCAVCVCWCSWFWYNYTSDCVLPVAAEPAQSPQTTLLDMQGRLLRCACRARCAVRMASSGYVISGTIAQIAQCSWLCDVHNVIAQSYSLRRHSRSGLVEWRVVL